MYKILWIALLLSAPSLALTQPEPTFETQLEINEAVSLTGGFIMDCPERLVELLRDEDEDEWFLCVDTSERGMTAAQLTVRADFGFSDWVNVASWEESDLGYITGLSNIERRELLIIYVFGEYRPGIVYQVVLNR